MLEVRNDRADEAYNEFRDFETIQQLLDEISDELARVADDNNRATAFAKNSSHYVKWYTSIDERESEQRAEFIKEHSHDWEEEPKAAPVQEPLQPEQQV
jgi:hypothetical protein